MFQFIRKKTKGKTFACPLDGELIPLSEVKDEVFAKGMMGTGFAIHPHSSKVFAPVTGVVSVVFPTAHAFGITTKKGMEVLIHIGIDTVELNGKGFITHIKQGGMIQQGDLLVEVDLPYLKQKGKLDTCIILFPNQEKISLCKEQKIVKHGDTTIVEIY